MENNFKNMHYENILNTLYERIPELLNYWNYKELVEKDFGNIDNKYVIFGVFSRFIIDSFRQNEVKLLKKIVHFLEDMASSHDLDVQTLLSTEVLESLNPKEEYYYGLKKIFGKNTLEELKLIENYKPRSFQK